MKHFPIFLISLALLCNFGCVGKNQLSNEVKSTWRNDTIYNPIFYLPDTCIIDSVLFILMTKLSDTPCPYVNTEMNAESYKTWYTSVDSFLSSNIQKRGINESFCFRHIIDRIIPVMRDYGYDCTAVNGQIEWLKFGINLYTMFSAQNAIIKNSAMDLQMNWKDENEVWLLFISKLFPLLAYDICNCTGSSATFDVPITLSKIIQSRTQNLHGTFVKTDNVQEKSLNNLKGLINDINIMHWDYDKDTLIEDSIQDSNQKSAIQALVKWINIRSDLAEHVSDKRTFNNATISILDSISSGIYQYHILH